MFWLGCRRIGHRLWIGGVTADFTPPRASSARRRLRPRASRTGCYCGLRDRSRRPSRKALSLSPLIAFRAAAGSTPKQPRGVETQDLILDLGSQLRIFVRVDQIVGDRDSPHSLDLALGAAVPDRIGSPHDVVSAGDLDHLAEHVHTASAARRPTGCQRYCRARNRYS